MLMQIPMVIGVFFIAPKINTNRALWTVLSAVPGIGMFVFYVFFFRWMAYIADALNVLTERKNSN